MILVFEKTFLIEQKYPFHKLLYLGSRKRGWGL